jgi:hypothetical protein
MIDLNWMVFFVLPTIATMMVSERMARVRHRSAYTWASVAMITGPLPLAPVALYLLGSPDTRTC